MVYYLSPPILKLTETKTTSEYFSKKNDNFYRNIGNYLLDSTKIILTINLLPVNTTDNINNFIT